MTPVAQRVDSVREALGWLQALPNSATTGDLRLDSRSVQRGDIFVALGGAKEDGRRYLGDAFGRGAKAALADDDEWPAGIAEAANVLRVRGLRAALGPIAAGYYGRPSERMLSVGVTGTNGKTSCSQWIAQLLTRTGRRCAVIGTVGIGFPGALQPSELTTPDAVSLQREVRALLEAGAQALAMEVSSIGLAQHRVDGMHFDVTLFTNLTRDHLDIHGTMERYEAAKARLFEWAGLRHAVINLDDARRTADRGASACERRRRHRLQREREMSPRGRSRRGCWRATCKRRPTASPSSSVSMVAGRWSPCRWSGISTWPTCSAWSAYRSPVASPPTRRSLRCPDLVPPPGRMQRVPQATQPLVVVDYAHTPDALAQALAAVRPLARARRGRLWIVFGAGGDRDPGKRAPMGRAAAAAADVVVVTSDNPRTEDPRAIVAQIVEGAASARAADHRDRARPRDRARRARGRPRRRRADRGKGPRGLPDRRQRAAPVLGRRARTAGDPPPRGGRLSALMTVSELARSVGARQVLGDARVTFASVSTDTRTLAPGALFVALRGERFDGHAYADAAVERGAVALLVEHPVEAAVPQIVVTDSRHALGVGAAQWRARFALPVIAVTGSNGKTTVTQMIGSILAQAYGERHRLATQRQPEQRDRRAADAVATEAGSTRPPCSSSA